MAKVAWPQKSCLEFWERVENNDWVIEKTNQVGKPNQRTPDGNYPALKDLFRIHLSSIKNSNTFRVYALQYKKVTKNNTLQWINEGSFNRNASGPSTMMGKYTLHIL